MSTKCEVLRSLVRFSLSPFAVTILITCVLFIPAGAQNIAYTENNLDQSLRGSSNVDPSTLGMSFSVPLGNYPGRGASMPVTMNYSSKVWRIKRLGTWTSIPGDVHSDVSPKFGEYSVSGWTTNLDVPWLEYTGGAQPYDVEGNPVCLSCDPAPSGGTFVQRIAMHMPDGSTHEMRKSDTPVERSFTEGAPPLTGIYISTDGARMKYDADQKVLYLPDGSRYWLTAPGGVQYIDRNGNTLTYNSSTKQWTDTTGRVISVVLNNTIDSGQTQKTQAISLPGFGTSTQQYSLVWKKLHVLLGYSDQNQMPFNGNENCFSRTLQSPYLFIGDWPSHACGVRFNPSVLAEIILPNDLKYTFNYNTYGEITKITLPTGGYYRYDYDKVVGLDYENSAPNTLYGQANRGVTARYVCDAGACTSQQEQVWQYLATNNSTYLLTSVTDPLGVKTERYLYKAHNLTYFGFENALAGHAYDERTYNASGQMLRRTLTEWAETPGQLQPPFQLYYAGRDARPSKQVGVILDTGGNALASIATTNYDADLNEVAINRYDHVSVEPTTARTGDINSFPLGTLLRTEEAMFLVNDTNIAQATRDAYRARHLIALPSYTRVKNGATIFAETQLKYDERAYPVLAYSVTPPGWSNPPGVRGNVTTTRRWLNVNGSYIETHSQYDQCGNLRKSWDGNGKVTETLYADSFSDGANRNTFAYATSVITPIPDPTGNFGSNQPLTSSTVFEFNTGKVVTTTDANNQTTAYSYLDDSGNVDPLIRLRKVTLPGGLGETKYEYGDAPGDLYIRALKKQNATTWVEDRISFDGMARVWRSGHYEGSGSWSVTDTEYDLLGRVKRVTNPYFADGLSGATPGDAAWTATDYDALGRVIRITTPDDAQVNTQYSGVQVTVTDQAGKKRQNKTDAIGRLTEVIEDPGGLGFVTTYLYDALDNLRKVTQSGQIRWFAYDSLSRLIRAKNPEQDTNNSLPPHTDPVTGGSGWAIAYSYDANGNLVSKTDARNFTTNYTYDALNRNTKVDYSTTTALNPDNKLVYDNNNPDAYGKGRLWLSYARGDFTNGTDTDHTAIDGYDALGRPLSLRQHFKVNGVWKPGVSVGYTTSVTYDLAGNVKTMTYPSGRSVNYSYDAAGRLSSFTGNLGDGQLRTYSTIAQYHPAGMIERETFGTQTPLHQKKRYNNRLQLGDLRLSTGSDALSYDRGALLFFYGPNAVASNNPFANDQTNNGNMLRQEHYVPISGGGEVIPQADNYTYDALNRISGVVEPNVFSQEYDYDPWGNRRITRVTGGVNNYNPTYDPGRSNRIVGLSYDQAGNIISDLLTGGTMIYDPENRLLTASSGGTYTYDAGGKRTRRTAEGKETWYIYGIMGELLAEYGADGALSASQKEYGYRGGQLLIIAEIGSGGGTSSVKPTLKSSADLIGKGGPKADGNADGLSVADEPFADLEFNEDSGSITADTSSRNSAGTPIDGGTGMTARGYGNAPSSNGVGGELFADHPSAAAPSAPQKEYGYRGGSSIATVQSGGVVTVNPSANQSPDPGQVGGTAVSFPINTGHDLTTSSASRGRRGFSSQTKTCLWSSFPGVSGTKTRVTLKFDWALNASLNVSVFQDSFASAIADYEFRIEYSLDNGSTWIRRVGVGDSISMDAPGSDSRSINPSGSESIDLPNPSAIDITQIRVRDYISASANLMNDDDGSAFGLAKASVSLIRLEVDTVPVITGVSSSAVTHNSATISWTTNEPADSQVDYGTSQAYGQSTALNTASVTAHSQGLSGLAPGTQYHYRVKSRDATGNLVLSDNFTFTTSSLDTTAPVIYNVAAVGVTPTSATITWTTDEDSDSQVEYGTSQAYGQWTTLDPTRVTPHSQGLSGLTSETEYHYRVKSKDASGNLAMSGDFTFTTGDNTAPVIYNVAAVGVTTTTATITWTTNENSDSQVDYGTSQAYGQSTALNTASVTAHSRGLSGLTSGMLYHYRVRSKDSAGNLAVSGDFTFTTAQHGSAEIKWLVTDHLGSTRMVIDGTGSLAGIKRNDFAPFGDELSAGVGIRSANNGYSSDSVRQRFTGKERDSESQLDYFGARYFASIQGRFVSPDPLLNSGKPWEPQSWNRYAYVDNNPLRYTDPLGLYKWDKNCDENKDAACKAERDRFRKSHENIKKAAEGLKEGSKERKKLDDVLKRIGKEGEGNLKVAIGDAGSDKEGNDYLGKSFGNKMTVDFEAIDKIKNDFSLDQKEAEALDAGVVAHESEHAGAGGFITSIFSMSTERTALRTESYTYQGLRNTDVVFLLWNEQWRQLDMRTLEQKREGQIEKLLKRKKKEN